MKWVSIIAIFLGGCSTTSHLEKTNIKNKPIIYTPIDKSLLKDIKPYGDRELTLKEKLKQQKQKECRDKINKRNQEEKMRTGNEPNFLQELIDAYACDD